MSGREGFSAVREIVAKRYGADAVSYDPSDVEANKIAYSQERQVIHGGAFSKTVWAKIRENEIVKPAGQVTPSAKAWSGEGDPNATAFDEWIPESKWTDGMKRIAALSIVLAKELMRVDIEVRFCSSTHLLGAAAYGSRQLSFNKLRLGASWFDQPQFSEPILSLIIHEFGHEYSNDHLSKEYYHALCDLGARLIRRLRFLVADGIVSLLASFRNLFPLLQHHLQDLSIKREYCLIRLNNLIVLHLKRCCVC